jgi:hypothetical protein
MIGRKHLIDFKESLSLREESQRKFVHGTLSCLTETDQSVEYARIGCNGCCWFVNDCHAQRRITGGVYLDSFKVLGSAGGATMGSWTIAGPRAARSAHAAIGGIGFAYYDHGGEREKKKGEKRDNFTLAHGILL